jgi:hypothetical protein
MVERVQTNEGVEGDPGAAADAAALQAAESGRPNPPPNPDSPGLPEGGMEKFFDAKTGSYNWEGHAKDLEFRLTQSQRDRGQQQKPAGDLEIGANADDEAADASDQGDALDFQAVADEYLESGELSEDTYKAFEARGIPKDIVDSALAGEVAKAELQRQSIYGLAEGEENYRAMTEWASKNWSADQIAAYDEIMGSQNIGQMQIAVKALQSQYMESEGDYPAPAVQGASGHNENVGNFTSWAQVTQAMSDPRYGTDPAYRQQVEARMRGNIAY